MPEAVVSQDARPRVSVVTPFHNTERYLAECIESVLAQTYDHYEYLLVDNQSSDGSRAIAEAYARKDSRIRVHATDRLLPQDLNYSEALRRVAPESQYCKVVQADDWVFPRCIEEMVAVAEQHPSVGIVSSYYLQGTAVMGAGLPYPSSFVAGRDLARLQLQRGLFFVGSPTSVLLRTAAIRQTTPFYDPAVPHADTEACYRLLRNWDFGFVHQVLSFLRVSTESRTGSVQNYHPFSMDKFIIVTKFGHDFLNDDEYRRVYRYARDGYFGHLGDALVFGRDREFWRYHREGLASIGYRLRWYRLWYYALRTVADLIFNPKKTVGRLVARWRMNTRR